MTASSSTACPGTEPGLRIKIVSVTTYLLGTQESPDGWGEAYALAGRERAIEQMILALGEALTGQPAAGPRSFRNDALLGFAALLHCAAVMPNLLNAELYPDFLAAGAAIAETDFEIAHSAASLPQAPGLGVTMKEEVLAKLAVSKA